MARPTHIDLPPPTLPLHSQDVYYTPPTSPSPSSPPPLVPTTDLPLHLALDDDSLTTLEKIYLFSRSNASFHRIFIAHALPSFLDQVSPFDAIQYVLPLLSTLAVDDDDQVKHALAVELVSIIWWFFTHCQIIPDDSAPGPSSAISVQAFTPILGTLLLSSNALIGGAAQLAVVTLLTRLRKADEREDDPHLYDASCDDDDDCNWSSGLFHRSERAMFRDEILQQVVIGMGKLDVDIVDHPDEFHAGVPRSGLTFQSDKPHSSPSLSPLTPDEELVFYTPPEHPDINPYFPTSLPTTSYISESETVLSSSHHSTASILALTPPGRDAPSPDSDTFQNSTSSVDEMWPTNLNVTTASWRLSGLSVNQMQHQMTEHDEQAAVGRLSSMSLMASVAASGSLTDEMKEAFVKEVEHVGRDPVYWVRREASFAVGALAKVVPREVVTSSLLPLFESLTRDKVWHVRHSALFALPAILSRLSAAQRRSLALGVVVSMSRDPSSTVRSGVLEALGEVLYMFHEDDGGPPLELLHLFLGHRQGQDSHEETQDSPLESFYRDAERPLICAFNYPAVALSMGRDRWHLLRDQYLDIAADDAFKVRRTLAASLGELAKIIGPQNARRDLLQVWRGAVRAAEEEVRLKVVECLDTFIPALDDDPACVVLRELILVWDEKRFRSWRERESIAKALSEVIKLAKSSRMHHLVKELLLRTLEDNAAAVRETAIRTLPHVWLRFSLTKPELLSSLSLAIQGFAESDSYKKRMTYVACQQSLITLEDNGRSLLSLDNAFWTTFSSLADDPVVGVRIGVARLLKLISGRLWGTLRIDSISTNHSASRFLGTDLVSQIPSSIVERLSQDSSPDVRSYITNTPQASGATPHCHQSQKRLQAVFTFSRPPSQPVIFECTSCSFNDGMHTVRIGIPNKCNGHSTSGTEIDPTRHRIKSFGAPDDCRTLDQAGASVVGGKFDVDTKISMAVPA